MGKYNYELSIKKAVTFYKNNFKEQGLIPDTRYIENYNICPRCKMEMKTYRGEVVGASSVSAFLIMEKKTAVIYCLCRSCAKKIAKAPVYINDDTESAETEEYIYSKFPDLKPLESGCDESELEEQLKIFNNLR